MINIVELSAHFIAWAANPQARFLKGRFVWANWDVEELKDMAEDIKRSEKFTTCLHGFTRMILNSWKPSM